MCWKWESHYYYCLNISQHCTSQYCCTSQVSICWKNSPCMNVKSMVWEGFCRIIFHFNINILCKCHLSKYLKSVEKFTWGFVFVLFFWGFIYLFVCFLVCWRFCLFGFCFVLVFCCLLVFLLAFGLLFLFSYGDTSNYLFLIIIQW